MENNIEVMNSENKVETSNKDAEALDAQMNKSDSFESKREEILNKLNSPEEKEKIAKYRDEVHQELFGVSESFAKAREAAIKGIDSPESQASFENAYKEAMSYIDKISGKEAAMAAEERVASPEFQEALQAIKGAAKERLNAIIAEVNQPSISDMVEERKKSFQERMDEIKQEAERRVEAM